MRKAILFVICVVFAVPAVFAQSSNSPVNADNVTATVVNNCRVSTFDLDFGNYDPVVANATTDLDQTATINVFCTKGATFTSLSLNNGLNFSAPARQMAFGTERLQYNIFLDATHTTVWNATNMKTPTGVSTGRAVAIDGGYTVYGRVFAGQDVAAGGYADTVVATVNF